MAVKVQKPWIPFQMPCDLACLKLLVFTVEYAFDVPLYWAAGTVCEKVSDEADFRIEAQHSERAAAEWNKSKLAGNVHVPHVFWSHTSKRVLTQEWIDGVHINELSRLHSCGFERKWVARNVIAMFADQIFRSGFIHGDPHPRNLFVRWLETGTGRRPQICCLDHGMYLEFSDKFRNEYCRCLFPCTGVQMTNEKKTGFGCRLCCQT